MLGQRPIRNPITNAFLNTWSFFGSDHRNHQERAQAMGLGNVGLDRYARGHFIRPSGGQEDECQLFQGQEIEQARIDH